MGNAGEVKILIPFRLKNPKSRLSLFLNEEERRKLSLSMLSDVLRAVADAGCCASLSLILSENSHSHEVDELENVFKNVFEKACWIRWRIEIDERELDDAVNSRLGDRTAIIVSDLPLLNGELLRKFFETDADIVLTPGRRGGTNMMLVNRKLGFRVSYHYGSFFKHLSLAKLCGLKAKVFDSFFAGCDVDTPDDLLDVLLHAPESETGKYLKRIGFRVSLEKNPKLCRCRLEV